MAVQSTDGSKPTFLLCHDFINRLSVIISTCDLMQEEAHCAGTTDCPNMRRIPMLRAMAMEIVRKLRQNMELDEVTRTMLIGDRTDRINRAVECGNQSHEPVGTGSSEQL
jgi:hypothetical protein